MYTRIRYLTVYVNYTSFIFCVVCFYAHYARNVLPGKDVGTFKQHTQY